MVTATLNLGYYDIEYKTELNFIGDDSIVRVLENLCSAIKYQNKNIYKGAILTYINCKEENVKKQDKIKKEIQDFEKQIQDFRKNNKLKIFFHKKENNQLQQKKDQLQNLIEDESVIRFKLNRLHNAAKPLDGFRLQHEFEQMLNDLEFHYISGYSKDLDEVNRYEFYGDEKKLVEKAKTMLNELEEYVKSSAKSATSMATNFCNYLDKKESVNGKEFLEKE